jgi:hypothetical protein
MKHTDDQIIDGYFKYQQTNADEDFWAWEEVDALCHDLPSGLRITRKLVEAAPSNWCLSLIGAGPLEDLVYRFGLPAVNAIAEIAGESKLMQRAMLSVNVDEDSPAFEVWETLLKAYHGDIDAF